MIELDERLGAIAQLIEPCACVADIGTDHGRLGAFLLQSQRCQKVQFCDISDSSLAKARALINRLGMSERAYFGVGDGLDAVVGEVQNVVVAGMGGQTIAGIIERGRDKLGNASLVLQPNWDSYDLRLTLARNGFAIDAESLARAANRWYVIIRARIAGEMVEYSHLELLAGPALLKRRDANLKGYAEFRKKVAQKALDGAKRGDGQRAEALWIQIRDWEEIMKWL